ncbi:MAG TPA: hypothetical protein PLY62_08000 [Bacteroidales bacterium]|nr:hypothetical protein [Bacteroidales bacterium]HOC96101.1 hypothetical protein [Candidatus Cloacimonadota bacterium]HPH53981.1 hypothetical protein [Bacteroidales bacterium]HRS50791.1 hypothetical protein [Candidatus Cloacimonadota bacterium]
MEYSPRRKYRIEKKNAFDPTILHLRDEYREDSFDLQASLNPDEYYTLMSFITATGNLYLEYTAYNEVRSQFPVTVSQFPKCPDDLHEYTEKVKFSLESRYIGSPGYIDFGIIIIEDDGDNITSS